MTNKPMLSVERNPLGLSSEAYSVMLGMLEHCLNIRACMGMDEGFKDFDTEEEHDFVKELRALLDKEVDGNSHAPKHQGKPVAQSEFEPDAICLESDGCPTEGAVLKRFWRENQPDPVLCEFYEAEDFPSLVRELVGHVDQLQEAAKRNVKPWEDTFPPTLLPAYIARINAEQPAPVAVVMPEHTMRSVMDAIQQARGFPMLTSNQCHALAESLNYVARLNGVKT